MSESEKSVTEAASAAFEGVEGAVGLGVDIVEIARMRRILERTPSFREKVFSEEERSYCESTANPEVHYATRFAAKEAVLKALGTGFSRGIANHDVEVRRNAKGRPFVVLHGRAKEVADEQSVRELPLSLSYTHTDAVACALAITEESVRAQEERVNPMEELAKQFKEARSLLDEMDAPKKASVTLFSLSLTTIPNHPYSKNRFKDSASNLAIHRQSTGPCGANPHGGVHQASSAAQRGLSERLDVAVRIRGPTGPPVTPPSPISPGCGAGPRRSRARRRWRARTAAAARWP